MLHYVALNSCVDLTDILQLLMAGRIPRSTEQCEVPAIALPQVWGYEGEKRMEMVCCAGFLVCLF